MNILRRAPLHPWMARPVGEPITAFAQTPDGSILEAAGLSYADPLPGRRARELPGRAGPAGRMMEPSDQAREPWMRRRVA